jgi:hypothetical protein
MNEEQAAAFYAKMDRPTPPQGESVLSAARMAQERPGASGPSDIPPRPFTALLPQMAGAMK